MLAWDDDSDMRAWFSCCKHACSLLLAAALSGCGLGSAEMFFVKPGSFDYYSCQDLAKAQAEAQLRERDLKALIDRAEQGILGGFIATTTYRSQYIKAQGDLKLLAETAQAKNCAINPATNRIELSPQR